MTTILIVEDEHLLREGMQEMLEIRGYQVVGADDGLASIEVPGHADFLAKVQRLVGP